MVSDKQNAILFRSTLNSIFDYLNLPRVKYKSMINTKKPKLYFAVPFLMLFLVASFFVAAPNVSANSGGNVPAGCPGGPMGPPSPGTVCPNGGPVTPDNSLPAGCPGGPMGPPAPNTVCPARPGRPECAISGGSCNPTASSKSNSGNRYSDATNEEPKRARNTCASWNDCPLLSSYVVPAINALSGAVGIVVVIMIIWGGIQYTSARDNPQQAAAAKEHIRNAIFALVIYIFIVAFINWIVPGGVFNA